MSQPLNALILSGDLFLTSQLQGAVQRAGFTCRVCPTQASCVEQLAANPIEWVIADVELPKLDYAALRAAAPEGCRIIAYGPHLKVDLLEAAEAAGCDMVMTRGQVTSMLERVLRNPAT